MKKINVMKIVRILLAVLMIASFLFFILGQIFLPKENEFRHGSVEKFKPQWTQIMSDGSRVNVNLPGNCQAKYGEWVTIETVLPATLKETSICMRSMQQELKIYVNDELRYEYSTLDTQLFGKTSTMAYVFIPIYEEDANAVLRVEFMTKSSYAGYVSDMYIGNRTDIIQHFCDLYAPAAIVAALLLLLGVGTIFTNLIIMIFYKKKSDLWHLGNAIVMAASWLIVESKLRQFFLPNSTVAMLMGFLLIAILPYPFLAYMDCVQKKRYQKAYITIGIATAVNFIVVFILQALNIKDFFETMGSSHIIIGVMLVETAITIILDTIKGRVREYREVAIGFLALTIAGIVEIGLAYVVSARYNGIALCIGLVLLIFFAALKSVRDLFNIEKEKQYAIATSESKAQFLANMSHEIRTPINTIVGMNEMIIRENDNATIDEYARNIKNASTMLLGIINDILDFSKIEAGKLQIVENDYKLASMIKDMMLSLEMRTRNKSLILNVDIDENLPSVLKGDEIRIKQILNNLLSNAVKYTEKGSVTFSVSGEQDADGFKLILKIADTGKGIKKEDIESLFESFKRLELEKNRYIEGTGLGLNITKLLVDLMNGKIDVESEYGKGSCFTVTLPQEVIDNTPMGNIANQSQQFKKEEQEHISIPDANILVVDDTKINLKVIEALLKRTLAKVDTATGGIECFEMTKNKKYDVILMDHMMPEPDGIQTLHMIKEDKSNVNNETPIIVLTANAIAGAKENYIKEGFNGYLSKPVKPEELEEILKGYVVNVK